MFFPKKKKDILVIISTLILSFITFSHARESKGGSSASDYRIPLFAVDSEGKPYLDLKKEDLELYINEKLIETAELKNFSLPQAAEIPERSRNPEKINFIVFDSMFSSNFGVKRSRQIASKIVANAPAGDSFVLLVNSPREGLKLIFGPEGDKEVLLKKIKKAKLYPGADWFKDMFSSRDSFMERFTAESDYNANQYADPFRLPPETSLDYRKQYIQEVRRFIQEADQIRFAFQMVDKPKILYFFSEGFQDAERMDKLFNPSLVETPDFSRSSQEIKFDTIDFSGVIHEYYRKLLDIFKESGNIIYSVNPGQLKTMSYDPSGAMMLEFLTGGERYYFQGLDMDALIDGLLNASAAYYELVCSREGIPGREQKIALNCHDENIHLYTPHLMIEKTYNQMAAGQKKMFAWDIATEGFLSQMAGRTEKADYRKTITTTKEKLYQCTIDLIIPVEMQNHPADIFYLSLQKKAKKWNIQMTSKTVSREEKLIFILKEKMNNYDLYFVFIDRATGKAISNKID
jgi:hypothetical protein